MHTLGFFTSLVIRTLYAQAHTQSQSKKKSNLAREITNIIQL